MDVVFTLDTDWSPPEALEYVFTEIVDPRLALTVFCTGYYDPVEHRPGTEVGLHYNAENLGFEGGFREVASRLPHARGARGHSLAFSERLRPLYEEYDIRYDSSYLMFRQQDILPFHIARSTWEFPVYFLDMFYLEYASGARAAAPRHEELAEAGLKVLIFHPVHLILNTPSTEFYREAKLHYQDVEGLLARQNRGWGIRSLFHEIQNWALSEGWGQRTLSDLVATLNAPRPVP